MSERQDKDRGLSEVASAYQKAGPILAGVWQLIGSTLLTTLLGWWLDKKLETSPWLLIGGAVLGIGVGMYGFIRTALATTKKPGPPTKGSGPEETRRSDT